MLIFMQLDYVKFLTPEVIFYKNSCNFHFSQMNLNFSYLQWIIKLFVLVKKKNTLINYND